MEFDTEADAKSYSLGVTARHYTLEEAENQIQSYMKYAHNSTSEEERDGWYDEVKKIKDWIESDDFINGHFPCGIDELILNLIEWRASLYSFQSIGSKTNPFEKHLFHAQWLMGSTYAMFCIIGKLVSKDERDNSLRKLWADVSKYIELSGLCKKNEIDEIQRQFHHKNGYFTNLNSKAILFRNKVIAHNESTPRVEWCEIDSDIKLLVRIWSLITMWSSHGIIEPFKTNDVALSGLDNVYNQAEMRELKNKRNEFLKDVRKWTISSLVDGEVVTERSPFISIHVSINMQPLKSSNTQNA